MARERPFMAGRGSKEGAMDGLNLFFGALLGANLGTLEGLKLVSYVQLATLLAGTVMALRIVSTAERRGRAVIVLAVWMSFVLILEFISSRRAAAPQEPPAA